MKREMFGHAWVLFLGVVACSMPEAVELWPDVEEPTEPVEPTPTPAPEEPVMEPEPVVDTGSVDTGPVDADGDGYGAHEDCDDLDFTIHPGAQDLCDGIDDDCDGQADDDVRRDWVLVTVDSSIGAVRVIDKNTAATAVLSTLSQSISGLNTMDVRVDGLPIAHSNTRNLYELDACTGQIDLIGPTGVGDMGGIAFDRDGVLWGLDQNNDQIVRVDPNTGLGTPMQPVGFALGPNGLAFDCATNTFYGLHGGDLFTIDAATGVIGPMRPTGISFSGVGLDFDHQERVLYTTTGGRRGLWTIDPVTLATRQIGTLDGSGSIDDIALHPPCSTP